MGILAIWILKEQGTPLLKRDFGLNITMDSALFSGFMSAMMTFSQALTSSELDLISMGNYQVQITCKEELIFCLIHDRNTSKASSSKILVEIQECFFDHYQLDVLKQDIIDVRIIEPFGEIIDNIVKRTRRIPISSSHQPRYRTSVSTTSSKRYQGAALPSYESTVLIELERQLKKPIPKISNINWSSFGFTVKEGHVIELGLYKQELSSLPNSFGNLTHLQKVFLSSNQLSNLPKSFENLRSIKTVDLRNNWLKVLPEGFGKLNNLKSLDLRNNNLESLPKSFNRLSQLIELDLSWNQLSELPMSFGQLRHLRELALFNNKLSFLPKSFCRLSQLKKLDLSWNQFTTLPLNFGDLRALQTLCLDGNPLSSLPATFRNLRELKKLDLSNTHLASSRTERKKIERSLMCCGVVWNS